MPRHRLTALLMTVFTSAFATIAHAQDAAPDAPELPQQSRSQTSFAVELLGEYLHDADVDDTSGKVEIVRVGAELSLRHAVNDRLAVIGSFRHEVSDYDFSSPAGLFPGSVDTDSPFDDVHDSLLSLGFTYGIDGTWSLFATGFLGAGYESGASIDDALYGGGFAGFGYAFSEEFSLQLGVGVRTRIEDDALILPVIAFRWQLNETLRLESEGLSLRLAWSATEELTVSAFARYSNRDYRTDNSNAYLPDGAFSDDRVTLGLRTDWKASPSFQLTLEAGLAVWQEFTFHNSSGDEIGTADTDPQLMLRAGIEFRF